MAVETEWQTRICKSIRSQGGYAQKWASGYIVGVPDLVCSMPNIGPFFMEVKLINKVSPGFKRKIDVSVKQNLELNGLIAGGALAMVGVVSEVMKADIRPANVVNLTLIPVGEEVLNWNDIGSKWPTCAWQGAIRGFTGVEQAIHSFMRMIR